MFTQYKKGQVTVYIIVGLVLLLFVSAYLIMYNAVAPEVTADDLTVFGTFSAEAAFLQSCLVTASEDALLINGLKGGLYAPQQHIFGDYRSPITTFYKAGSVIAPTNGAVMESLALEFNDFFLECVRTYNETATMQIGSPNTNVQILTDRVMFNTVWPVTFTKDQERRIFRDFSHTISDVRLSKILDLARELSFIQTTDVEYICASCVVELADLHYMWIDFVDVGELRTVYTFTDLFSDINGGPYVFVMAHEHAP